MTWAVDAPRARRRPNSRTRRRPSNNTTAYCTRAPRQRWRSAASGCQSRETASSARAAGVRAAASIGGRDGRHRFVYAVHTPAVERLLLTVRDAGLARPMLPYLVDHWESSVHQLEEALGADRGGGTNGQSWAELAELGALLDTLESKLIEFETALEAEPRTIDRSRAEYLEMLARYAHQLTVRIGEQLRGSSLIEDRLAAVAVQQPLLDLVRAMTAIAEERARRAWDQKFAWAAADGRQLRFHHVVGLRRMLQVMEKAGGPPALLAGAVPRGRARPGCEPSAILRPPPSSCSAVRGLDAVFQPNALRRPGAATAAQLRTGRRAPRFARPGPSFGSGGPWRCGTLHPPQRKALLAELARRDPELAYRVASHLWGVTWLGSPADPRGRLPIDGVAATNGPVSCISTECRRRGSLDGRGHVGPGSRCAAPLLLVGDQLAVVPLDAPGLYLEPLSTLGLRAGCARSASKAWAFRRPEARSTATALAVSGPYSARPISCRSPTAWRTCSASGRSPTRRAGCSSPVCSTTRRPAIRSASSARSRRWSPSWPRGGSSSRRWTNRWRRPTSPPPRSGRSWSRPWRPGPGPRPGSVTYNAGQVFGGTAFTEDDVLSKFYRDAAAWRFRPAQRRGLRPARRRPTHDWRIDGRRLASLREEAGLFDDVSQRKALQAELDELRVQRSRLRAGQRLAGRDHRDRGGRRRRAGSTGGGLGELREAWPARTPLLAGKALLLRTHARMEGLAAEVETALLRVWLDKASQSLESSRRSPRAPTPPPPGRRRPGAGPPVTLRRLLARPVADSGDFLREAVDLAQPRLVPESGRRTRTWPTARADPRQLAATSARRAKDCPTSGTSSAATAPTRKTSTSSAARLLPHADPARAGRRGAAEGRLLPADDERPAPRRLRRRADDPGQHEHRHDADPRRPRQGPAQGAKELASWIADCFARSARSWRSCCNLRAAGRGGSRRTARCEKRLRSGRARPRSGPWRILCRRWEGAGRVRPSTCRPCGAHH